VLLVGCGALGTHLADTLVRAGVGFLRIVDRDFIELNNLQRQVLFDEEDVAAGLPKAEAAARRLSRINSAVRVEVVVADASHRNNRATGRRRRAAARRHGQLRNALFDQRPGRCHPPALDLRRCVGANRPEHADPA